MWLAIELVLKPLWFTSRKKNGTSDHGIWGPQKAYFHAYIIHCHGPTCLVVGDSERQKRFSPYKYQGAVAKKCRFYIILYFYIYPNCFHSYEQWREEEGEMSNMKKFLKTVFLDILKIKSTHPLFGAWSLLFVHVRFTPNHRPKGSEMHFSKKSNYGSVTMEKCPLTWDNFTVHDVNKP